FLLDLFVPMFGVCFERIVERRIGAEGREKRRLVIGAAANPAVRHPRPLGDRVARADEILGGPRPLVELVRKAAVTSIGLGHEQVLACRIVQGIVQSCDHPDGVAKTRMRRYILDPLAVNPDLTAVTDALEIFGTRHGSNTWCDAITFGNN